MSSILMFGATGLIGTFIVDELTRELQSGSFDRVGIFTSQSTIDKKSSMIQKLRSSGVEIFVGDVNNKDDIRKVLEGTVSSLNPSTAENASKPFDTIINAAGRNAILTQISILEVAESVPTVKRFFPSEYGTDIEYDPKTSPSEPPHQMKLKVRAYIRENIQRLEYTYLVTGPYAELYLGNSAVAPETGSFDVQGKKATLLYDGEGKVSLTAMPDVGKLLVAALKAPAAARNRALKVNSFTATPHEVVAEFERQTGGDKWDISYVSRDEVLKNEKKAYDESSPLSTLHTLKRIWADGGTLYEKRDNDEINFNGGETLQEQVKKAITAQTK